MNIQTKGIYMHLVILVLQTNDMRDIAPSGRIKVPPLVLPSHHREFGSAGAGVEALLWDSNVHPLLELPRYTHERSDNGTTSPSSQFNS